MPDVGNPPDLWDPRVAANDADDRPIIGAMAQYAGPQYTAEEIWGHYCRFAEVHSDEETNLRRLAARIRAFDIPTLRGQTFVVSRLREVASAVKAMLIDRLPDVPWDSIGASKTSHIGSTKKYGLLHEIINAPRDEATHDPMVLELYGRLIQVNGQPVGVGWFRDLLPRDRAVDENTEIGQMTFRIERATYANTRTPGIGVPFYM